MLDAKRMLSVVEVTLACVLVVLAATGDLTRIPEAAAQRSIWVDHGLADGVREGIADLEPLFLGATYDPAIPSPESVLGFPLGARPVCHQEVLTYLESLAEASPCVRLVCYGETHEGRALVVAVITGEANMNRLDEIKEQLGQIADPREKSPPSVENLPVCIWAGCCVHGDETSSTDAALAVAHHLAACREPEVAELRDHLLILLDPLQNPDGRERILAQWRALAGVVPDGDDQSLRHRGLWFGGRTNHYLFDMNRDWFLVSQPETYARVRFVTDWHPQLMIDAHEMGSQATYLFSPPREPFNPSITEYNHHWWRIFSRDQAAAFDRHGWEYYTRDWNEEWFPGYGSSWGAGIGAVGILYEQAGVEGARVARLDGTIMTYRETVHRQVTSFMSNFRTASRHREEFLRSYREERAREFSAGAGAVVFLAQAQPAREAYLLRSLFASGVEVYRTTKAVGLSDLRSYWTDETAGKAAIPEGSLVVPVKQPRGRLVETMYAFDPQMDEEFLRTERRRLEKEQRTRLYEATAWSLSLSCGLPVYRARSIPAKSLERLDAESEVHGCVVHPEATFGFLIDGTDDRCLRALARLWEGGCTVHAAREPFTIEGGAFARGTLLVKRVLQNRLAPEVLDLDGDILAGFLQDVAEETGVTLVGVNTALSDEGPDLGSRRFVQLERSTVAVLAGDRVSTSSYGGIAWLLDHELGLPFAALSVTDVSTFDLRRYNVMVIPDSWGGPRIYESALDVSGLRRLRSWVRDGGTLIAVGSAAAFVADSTSSLGRVRLRRQVLTELAERTGWRVSVEDDTAEPGSNRKRRGDIDKDDFYKGELEWAKSPGVMDGFLEGGVTALRRPEPFWKWAVGRSAKQIEEEDVRMRLFHPRGAILKADLDEEHWLASGCGVFSTPGSPTACDGEASPDPPDALPLCGEASGSWMPVETYTQYALIASDPADVVGAFAPEDSLRLSGLLWPEARERWTRTAYLTREREGRGQIILFVSPPCRRAAFKSSQRAFLNAVLLGPGMGTSREWPWER